MITVEKVYNGDTPDIRISDATKSFMIARNNLPDLCWYPENVNSFINSEDVTFVISEADGDIYWLFEKLYQDIISGNIFPLSEEDLSGKTKHEIKQDEANARKRNIDLAKATGLVSLLDDNKLISWHSDDYDEYDYAAVLTIMKVQNQIKITFSSNKENLESSQMWVPSHYVRICESGSRYQSFFVVFSHFRRQLQLLNWAPSSGLTTKPFENKLP